MQGLTLFSLVILIVEVTSSEFLKGLINHPVTYPCNIIKCPENKLCLLEVKNNTCSGCTVSPLCLSSDNLPASECPYGFPIVNTKSDNIVPLHCHYDKDCPSRSFCFGQEIYGICCLGSYSIGRPFHSEVNQYIPDLNEQQVEKNREFLPQDIGLANLVGIILKKSYQQNNSGKTGGPEAELISNFDKTSKQMDNFQKARKDSTFHQKFLVDLRAGTDIKGKQIVYFKNRSRRSPNGFFDSLHPSERGLEVPLEKPGACSNVRLGKWSGGCMDTCFNDADCYSNLKCCYNGCARSCQFPIVSYDPDISSKKPGRCPRLSSIGLSECTGRLCSMDTDCPADDICCNSGDCGRICQHPVPNSPYW